MDAASMHARAQAVFADVLVHVVDDDLARPTPCVEWSVSDLLDHVVEGNRWAVERMGGSPVEPDGDDRVAVNAAAADRAIAVFGAPGWDDTIVELPFGSITAPVYASIRSGDLYAHAWDLATAIGRDTDLDRELGEAILAATAPVLSPGLRGTGRPFGDEQTCPADRPVADRLAALLGRPV